MDLYASQCSTRASTSDSVTLPEQPALGFWEQLLPDLIRDISVFSVASLPDDGADLRASVTLTGDNVQQISTPETIFCPSPHATLTDRNTPSVDMLPGLLRCLGHEQSQDEDIVPPSWRSGHSLPGSEALLSEGALGEWGQDTDGIPRIPRH